MASEGLLYKGEGASPICVAYLQSALIKRGIGLELIDDRHFLQEGWDKYIDLLIMPGGRDLPYHKKFAGKINRKIKQFVEGGGAYWGICAGAYFGASFVEFDKDGPLEVVGERELGFFPGKAVGPAYTDKRFVYSSNAGARVAKLAYGDRVVYNHFNGGCIFQDADKFSGVDVIARYAELPSSPAAIIRCKCGKGRALLCGTHPEYPVDDNDEERIHFFDDLINNHLN